MAAHFLNADLEILSNHPLDSLRDEIGSRACNLYCGAGRDYGYFAVFEIDDHPNKQQPEDLVLRFCTLIESLSESGIAMWNNANQRIIDLGYEVDDGQERLAMNLSPQTLARMSALNVVLAFTIYPADSTGP